MEENTGVNQEDFRLAMSSWATGVSVITGLTALEPATPIGMVCNSLISISLEEKLILWSVNKSSTSYEDWIRAKTFNVHFLADDQKDLVARFAKKGGDKFESLQFESSQAGNPILNGVNIRMECATTQTFDTHDHMLIIGKVQALENNGKVPLLFLHRSLQNIGKLQINLMEGK